jgi:hypothetical protein
MRISEHLFRKAQKLFLNFSDQMQLDYCYLTNSYHLKNPKFNDCYPLELLLIADYNFTGNKIKDIRTLLQVSHRWMIGFHHGYIGKTCRCKNKEYCEGYAEGQLANMQNKAKA